MRLSLDADVQRLLHVMSTTAGTTMLAQMSAMQLLANFSAPHTLLQKTGMLVMSALSHLSGL